MGSGNGLSPVRRQVIAWTNAGLHSIGLLGTNVSEIWIEVLSFLFKKIHSKMWSTIFNIWILLLVRRHIYIKTPPWKLHYVTLLFEVEFWHVFLYTVLMALCVKNHIVKQRVFWSCKWHHMSHSVWTYRQFDFLLNTLFAPQQYKRQNSNYWPCDINSL